MLVEMQPVKSSASSEKSSNVIANMDCEEEELSPAQIASYTQAENDYQTLWTSLQKKLKSKGVTEISEPILLAQFPKFVSNLAFYIDQSLIKKSAGLPLAGQPLVQTLTSHPSKVIPPAQSSLNVMTPQNALTGSASKVSTGSLLANTTIVPVGTKPLNPSVSRGRGRGIVNRGRGSYSRVSSIPPTNTVNISISPNVTANPDTISQPQSVNFKDINSNKSADKTYPSLIVIARPTLQIKKMTPQQMKSACQERSLVDGRVKQVLLYTPTKFTEWLIQQGLLRSEQGCSLHIDSDMNPVKLKLGMYSDSSKYPHSGGYVWLSDCCPKQTVSVFRGSIFEGAPYPPNVLLKLMYHWACQTSMMNIVAWVKVNSLFIKTFFTSLRAVCTAALHEKYEKLGGEGVKVEVGIISLGTTTSDGGGRHVKIEVLGMMESESKLIRLRAIEPFSESNRNCPRKLRNDLAPLEQWVHKNSIILTDFTIDKNTLNSMGYKHIIQAATLDPNKKLQKNSNINVMDYLKKVVPRMFQNTLAFLSRQMIQQFLDELVWRERWGFVSAKAFDSLMEHLAELTKLQTGDLLLPRLQRIALNPFKDWKYSNWKINCAADETMDLSELESSSSKLQPTTDSAASTSVNRLARKRPANDPQPVAGKLPAISHCDLTKDSDLMALDCFYYGMIPAEKVVDDDDDEINMKCVVCSHNYNDIIALMKHLISHAFHDNSDRKELGSNPMCRYCLRTFVSDYWLQSHLAETHLKNESGLMCCICEDKFKDRTSLILHMHRSHVELELPYKCQICNFRTSQHTAMIDHFYDAHRKGKTVMCPFCLKTVALAANGKEITQNQYFFLNHIQKHKRKVLAKKCNKCVLWFVQKGLLVDHQNTDHPTCKDLENVQRFPAPAVDCAMMPRPKSSSKSFDITANHQKLTRDPVLNGNLFSKSNDLKAIRFEISEERPACSECESNIVEEDHFPGEFNCKKCKFVTNCYNAIIDHVTTFHDLRYSREPAFGKQVSGKPFMRSTDLNKPMYCCCGFESSSGNKLARHLVSCKKTSAYPSRMIGNQNVLALSKVDLEDEDYDPDDPDEIADEDTPRSSASSFDLRSIRRGRTVIN